MYYVYRLRTALLRSEDLETEDYEYEYSLHTLSGRVGRLSNFLFNGCGLVCFSCFDWHNAITVIFNTGSWNRKWRHQLRQVANKFFQVPSLISSFGFSFSRLLETFGFIYVELTPPYVTHAYTLEHTLTYTHTHTKIQRHKHTQERCWALVDVHSFWLTSLVAVPQYGLGLHEDLQFNLHDAPDRPLERLLAVLSANVAGFSIQLLGLHQRVAGRSTSVKPFLAGIGYLNGLFHYRNRTGWSSIRGHCLKPCRTCFA